MNNQRVLLQGNRLCLVPYLEHHVPRYHQWLSDPEMLEATCSEPLTLEEEYDNQKTWLASSDKLTFILLAPLRSVLNDAALQFATQEAEDPTPDGLASTGNGQELSSTALQSNEAQSPLFLNADVSEAIATPPPSCSPTSSVPSRLTASLLDTTFVMIGDCNLFVPPYVEEDGVEVEVMIADKAFRRRGFAAEAVHLLMSYAVRELGYRHFVAKILSKNESSIALFTKKMNFSLFKEVKVFQESHFERRLSGDESVPQETLDWEKEFGYEKRCYEESIAKMVVLPAVPAELMD